jgi:hypothetical protein
VRIANPNIAILQQSPYGAQLAADLVSPSRLFELAATRFEAALATSRIGGPRTAPSAIVAVLALQQADSGLRNLKSVNVPSTPFDVRTRAARASDAARHGIDLLRRYHEAVIGRGDRPHDLDTLPTSTIALLDESRLHLRTAIAIARHS